MGIPSYFSHIVKEHRDIIKELDPNIIFDNLYLDSNGIIYECANNSHNEWLDSKGNKKKYEKKLIKMVLLKIKEYIDVINPQKEILIAFDGVAPVAKLNQQRERRYKSWIQNEILCKSNSTCSSGIASTWDTCSITPGTEFMSLLSKEIRKHFSNNKSIRVSPPDEPGEGEHKIYSLIRDNPKYHKESRTAIYGLDADLIMLTLNHLDIAPSLYLYRETPHFIKSIDSTLEPCSSYVIDIPKFARYFKGSLDKLSSDSRDIVKDYVFMCFLLGNDFLPHFPSLNIRTGGIDKLLTIYSECIKNKKNFGLVKNNCIQWRYLRELIIKLAEIEYDSILEEHETREKRSKMNYRYCAGGDQRENIYEFQLTNIPIKERTLENFINPEEEGWEWRYYKSLFDINIDEERCKEICINYLEGLEWVLAYYTTGCKSWSWSYKYKYPPLFNDLVKFVPYFDTIFIEEETSGPVTPLTQLSYVLPREKLNLLPAKLLKRLLKEYPNWYEMNVDIIWAYCRYFWESHPILPEIKIDKLSELVNSCCKE